MAQTCGLSLLLTLLLPALGASTPGVEFRLNSAALSYVSEVGKAPLQRSLQVTVPHFLDRREVLQVNRIQIVKVHVARLRLKFIAGFGVRLLTAANFTFEVVRAKKPLELKMPVALMADMQVFQSAIGTPVVSISSCLSFFDNAVLSDSWDRPLPALMVLLQRHLKAVLRNKLCLSVSNLVQNLNVHLGTLIGLNPVGPESQIRYSVIDIPTVTDDYIAWNISAILFLLGKPIILSSNATLFMWPHPMGDEGVMATVVLSQGLFDASFLLLQKAGSLNLDITSQLKSDDNPLNTSSLGQLIPEVARQFPEPMPVVLKVRLGATPVATLSTNSATLRLQPFVEVLVPTSNSAFQSLFSLDVVVNLSLQLSVSKVKLQGSTSVLGAIQLTVASSNVGFINTDQVHELMGTVFERPLLDHLNALLSMGIPLPTVANLYYVNPQVFIHEGYVVISSELSYQC
ncbi:BPI fold-containing family B member 2 [Erinaceus europaeus]|uniref:BPI fold-containing family B member 2 n=1 Tax=Erinaceus europaeus TaxID=9365 RepID=A0A1S2ZQ25_ERIEU|nr:BPI fold-containing family B member 2 [Erinaceus europaeus]